MISEFNAIGPIFERMPIVRFSENPINWNSITKDILSHYAPKIPYNYMS